MKCLLKLPGKIINAVNGVHSNLLLAGEAAARVGEINGITKYLLINLFSPIPKNNIFISNFRLGADISLFLYNN